MTNYIVIMLEDYYYCFLATTAVLTGAVGIYYYHNGDSARMLMGRVGWEAAKMATRIQRWGTKLMGEFQSISGNEASEEEEEDAEQEDTCPDTLIYYKHGEENCYSTDSLEPSDLESQDFEGATVAFVRRADGESNMYKRINTSQLETTEYGSLAMEKVPKQFLQVELMLPSVSEAMDIHHNLSEFYVYGNKLLDSAFLEWYLQTYYGTELPDEYCLKIFDKDVNQLTMVRGDVIVLLEGTPAYALLREADLRIEEEKDSRPPSEANTAEETGHEGATDE